MAGEKLKVEWAVQNRAVIDALNQVTKSLNRTEKAAEKSARASQKGARDSTGMMQKLGRSIVSMGASYVGATQLASAFTEELLKQERIQKRQSTAVTSLQDVIAASAMNFGPEQTRRVRGLVTEEAPKLGTTMEGLVTVLGEAISAGAKDLDEAMSVASAAIRLQGGNAERASVLIQGALDIADFQNTKDFEGTLGQMSQFMRVARGIDPTQFMGNVRPGLAAATGSGFNLDGVSSERALEIATIFSQSVKDASGSVAKTGLINMFSRLDEFAPERSKTLKDKTTSTVSAEEIAAFKGTRNFDEKLEQFRNNDALLRQFLDIQKTGEAKSAIVKFIRNVDPEMQRNVGNTITDIANAGQAFRDLEKAVQEETQDLRAERTSQALVEAADVSGVGGTIGGARKVFGRALGIGVEGGAELPGNDLVTRQTALAELVTRQELGQDPVKAMIAILSEFTEEQSFFRRAIEGPNLTGEAADRINKQIAILESIDARLSQLNTNTQPQPAAPQAPPLAQPVPAAGLGDL